MEERKEENKRESKFSTKRRTSHAPLLSLSTRLWLSRLNLPRVEDPLASLLPWFHFNPLALRRQISLSTLMFRTATHSSNFHRHPATELSSTLTLSLHSTFALSRFIMFDSTALNLVLQLFRRLPFLCSPTKLASLPHIPNFNMPTAPPKSLSFTLISTISPNSIDNLDRLTRLPLASID